MRRLLGVLILILAAAMPAAAQFTTVTATVTDPNGLPYSGATVKAQLINGGVAVSGQATVTVSNAQQCTSSGLGSAPCKLPIQGTYGPVTLSPAGVFTLTLPDVTLILPALSQWLFTISISPGIPPPAGTGPQTFTYTSTGTLVSGASVSLSSQISAVSVLLSNTSGSASIGAAINVKAPPYSAPSNTKMITGVTWGAPGFPTGFQMNLFPSGTFAQTDVGKKISCVENASSIFRYVGSIVSVPNSTTINVNNVVSAGPGSANNCFWGTPDDAAVNAAWIAAATPFASCPLIDNAGNINPLACTNDSTLYFPCGGYSFSQNFAQSAGGQLLTVNIKTAAENCVVFFMQGDFSVAGVAANQGAFFTFQSQYAESFTLTAGAGMFSFSNNPIIQYACVHCEVHGPNITGVSDSALNSVLQVFGGNHSVFINPMVRDVGGPGNVDSGYLCDFLSVGSFDVFGYFCSNGPVNLRVQSVAGQATGSRITFHGGQSDECGTAARGCTEVLASSDVTFLGTGLFGGSTNGVPGLFVDGTSQARCSGCNVGPFSANGGGGLTVASGGKLWYDKTNIRCKTAPSACVTDNNPINSPGAIDVGGNEYTVGVGATKFAGTALPLATLTHTWNTCYVTITPFAADTMCNQFLDQPLQLLRIKASSNTSITCTVNPVVTITDGTNSQTLTIATGAATWDTGALASNVTFALGNTVTVSATSGTCATPPTNFSVTYNMQTVGGS
jgi:hypothetical protein